LSEPALRIRTGKPKNIRKNNYAKKYRKLKSGKIVRRGKCRLIFQGRKQRATQQGWAKIRAEAEKGKLHKGEKEVRKQQDLVGNEGLPSRYKKGDVTKQA
jgi:hypothetical protein